MHHFRLSTLCLSVLLCAALTPPCWGQTPAPALQTQFTLPLADQTTAAAVLLPTANGQAWLCYATQTGKIGLWILTPATTPPNPEPQPIPPPVPPPPVPPVPVPPVPVPQRLTIAVVEDPQTSTSEQRGVLANKTWRNLAGEKHDFRGIIPVDVIEKGTGKPPASLVPFLNAAKGRMLPWVMFGSATGIILWEGPLPATSAELIALIHKYGG